MEIKVDGKGNVNGILKMLAWIEFCGNIGHTPKHLKVYIDGDGSTKFRFKFKNNEQQNKYEKTRKNMLDDWNKKGKDLDYVEL